MTASWVKDQVCWIRVLINLSFLSTHRIYKSSWRWSNLLCLPLWTFDCIFKTKNDILPKNCQLQFCRYRQVLIFCGRTWFHQGSFWNIQNLNLILIRNIWAPKQISNEKFSTRQSIISSSNNFDIKFINTDLIKKVMNLIECQPFLGPVWSIYA
jgi:hypothetical protein